jgi:hypothetical protein
MPISHLPELNWRRAFADVALIFVGITWTVLKPYLRTRQETDEVLRLVEAQLADHG